MIFYLTYNDAPSGIYSSQVIDTVKFLQTDLKTNIKLVSLISIRGFFKNKKSILSQIPDAIVLPMFPGVARWRFNYLTLSVLAWLYKPTAIIGRSVLSTHLALKLKHNRKINKVVYDGRGAIAAEWKEYGVINNATMLNEIDGLEKEAVLQSDFRIAVSNELISHWQKQFHYNLNSHVVIPCTLNYAFKSVEITTETIAKSKALFNFKDDDVVYVYSGSLAGWQSFELLNSFLVKQLALSSQHKILFLSEIDKHITDLKIKFPTQVFNKKVSPNQVPNYLLAGNFGILIRENSITNQVASPVKFAEYVCCGLSVIISDNLGDYSKFVTENKCGSLVNEFNKMQVDKHTLNSLALKYFTKQNHIQSYKTLLNQLV